MSQADFYYKGRRFTYSGGFTDDRLEAAKERTVARIYAEEQGKEFFWQCFGSEEEMKQKLKELMVEAVFT